MGLVAALIAGVALAGGFKEGRARLTRVAPGEQFTTGPIELTIDQAVAVKSEHTNDWQIRIIGHGRTTGHRTIGMPLSAVNVKAPDSDVLGGIGFTTDGHGAVFNPGVPTFEFIIPFAFTAADVPLTTVLVKVDDLELDDTFRSQITDDTWVPTSTGHLIELPVTVQR